MFFSDLYKSTKSPLSRLRRLSQPAPKCPSPDDENADLVSKDRGRQKEAVKRFLAAKIRNDWEFKWPPSSEADVDPDAASLRNGLVTPPQERPLQERPRQERPPGKDTSADTPADAPADDDAASLYSTVSEDAAHWRPRLEWLSDFSDEDLTVMPAPRRYDDNFDATAATTLQAVAAQRKNTRRRRVRAEEEWNPGLACFNARRDAWTGAKTVRLRARPPPSPVSPSAQSTRHLSFWRTTSTGAALPTSPPSNTEPAPAPAPPTAAAPLSPVTSGETTALSSSDPETREPPAPSRESLGLAVETLVPIAPPLLPAANPMRASIGPATYGSIYDKIILQSLTPACPVNLGDVVGSCVAGWKRDGEWPTRPDPPAVVAVRNKKRRESLSHISTASAGRRMSFGFLGRKESNQNTTGLNEQDCPSELGTGTGKGIRKSLQRALGLGHERNI